MTEKETLQNLISHFPDFENWLPPQQLAVIAWFLDRVCKQAEFSVNDILRCLAHLDISFLDRFPFLAVYGGSLAIFVEKLLTSDESDIIKTSHGYKLKWRKRDKFDNEFKQFSSTPTSIAIHRLLEDLLTNILSAEETTYLEETIICYRHGANRAAIVMCWNLAFSHLCNFILKDTSKLAIFNQALHIQFPKKPTINTYSDFARFQESEILDLCNSTNLVNKNQYKKLKGKLDDRNMAAHPSTVTFTKVDVEHYIIDLFNNVVVAL